MWLIAELSAYWSCRLLTCMLNSGSCRWLWLILPKKQYGVWAIMFSSETCIKIYKNENCKTLKYTMFSYRPTRLSLCSCIWDGWSTLSKLLCGYQLVMDRRTLRATAGAWDCFNPSKKMKYETKYSMIFYQHTSAICNSRNLLVSPSGTE